MEIKGPKLTKGYIMRNANSQSSVEIFVFDVNEELYLIDELRVTKDQEN